MADSTLVDLSAFFPISFYISPFPWSDPFGLKYVLALSHFRSFTHVVFQFFLKPA